MIVDKKVERSPVHEVVDLGDSGDEDVGADGDEDGDDDSPQQRRRPATGRLGCRRARAAGRRA